MSFFLSLLNSGSSSRDLLRGCDLELMARTHECRWLQVFGFSVKVIVCDSTTLSGNAFLPALLSSLTTQCPQTEQGCSGWLTSSPDLVLHSKSVSHEHHALTRWLGESHTAQLMAGGEKLLSLTSCSDTTPGQTHCLVPRGLLQALSLLHSPLGQGALALSMMWCPWRVYGAWFLQKRALSVSFLGNQGNYVLPP